MHHCLKGLLKWADNPPRSQPNVGSLAYLTGFCENTVGEGTISDVLIYYIFLMIMFYQGMFGTPPPPI